MENLKIPAPEIPILDLGTDDDRSLGELVADAKIAAMQQGFDDRYSQGVNSFVQSRGEIDSQAIGVEIASALLEERRQTLIAIAIKTLLFSSVSGLTALLVGFTPIQSAIVFFPATVAAICTSKK